MLDPPHTNQNASVAAARLVDERCDQFEQAWRSGQRPTLETYFAELPDEARRRLAVELILLDVFYRHRQGELPRPDDYARVEILPLAVIDELIQRGLRAANQGVDASGDDITLAHTTSPSDSQVARAFGDYLLLDRIASGGMGVVYKARQISLNRLVAVKLILSGQFASEDEVKRFYGEAMSAARLEHPNIVSVYEVGQHAGQHFYSMALVEGTSLAARSMDGPFPPRVAAELMKQVALAIEYAHGKGVIHRDLKPSNILLDHQNRPRVTDFGLAKRVSDGTSLTMQGDVLGTPSFMPPEQAAGEIDAVGPTADVYSLGAVLYSLLSGRPPFQSASKLDTLRQVIEQEPVRLRQLNPALPRDLETITSRCLEKTPQRRFASAGALAEELERFLSGCPILSRPVSSIERVARWSRRQPVVAALLMAVALAVVLGSGTSLYFGRQAIRRADDERQRRRELEWSLYRSQIMQADLEWQVNNVNRADQILDGCDPALRNWEWSFLKRRCHSERLKCLGQDDRTRQVAYSPQGDQLVSAGINENKGTVRRWDAQTGAELAGWTCDAPVMSVAWSGDGKLVAAGLRDGQVVVWDMDGNRTPRFSKQLHQGEVYCVVFHPNSQSLASCAEDGVAKLLDTSNGKELREFVPQANVRSSLLCVAFDRTGTQFAAAGEQQDISIWNASSGELTHTLDTGTAITRAITFTEDGLGLLSADNGNSSLIRTWDLATKTAVASFQEHTAPVRAIAISPDGSTVASGGKDGTLIVWELKTGKRIRTWKAHALQVDSVVFSPQGREIASCGIDNLIRFWDLDSSADVPQSAGHTGRVNEVAFRPDGELVASASKDGTVRLWDAKRATAKGTLEGHRGMVWAVAFSRQHDWLVSTGEDGQVLRHKATSGQFLDQLTTDEQPIWSVDVHPDSDRIAFGGKDGCIHLWDVNQRREIQAWSAHPGGVSCVRFSPDGKWLASCGEDESVRLWRVDSDAAPRVLRKHVGKVWHVAFTRDGHRLATSGNDGTAVIWNLATGEAELTCKGHVGIIYAASFSPDGSRLATAGFDQTIKVWDMTTGLDLLTLRGPLWSVNSVSFSPDGKTIASGSSDALVQLWTARSTSRVGSNPRIAGDEAR